MQHAYTFNNDGCGFAVRVKGQILIKKGMWAFEEFWKRFKPYMQYEAIIHFRMASMGTITAENCHPFALKGGGALIHNGHMDAYGSKSQSDTAHWVDQVLNPLLATYPGALSQPAILRLLEDSIGRSKMVILTAQEALILNEELGHTEAGVWYSNSSYEAPRRVETRLSSSDGRWPQSLYARVEKEDMAEDYCESCCAGDARHVVCTQCLYDIERHQWNQ